MSITDDLPMGNVVKLKPTELPLKPVGFKLLIAILPAKDKSDGGVHYTDEMKARESHASIVGNVVGMGDLAYKDKDKFPTGPWCKKGDWVLFKSFSGSARCKIRDVEFRLINDDSIESVVSDPRLVKRVF